MQISEIIFIIAGVIIFAAYVVFDIRRLERIRKECAAYEEERTYLRKEEQYRGHTINILLRRTEGYPKYTDLRVRSSNIASVSNTITNHVDIPNKVIEAVNQVRAEIDFFLDEPERIKEIVKTI